MGKVKVRQEPWESHNDVVVRKYCGRQGGTHTIQEVVPEENIATMKYGAQVVKGELKSALLDGDTQNYDLDHGFSRHPIDDDCRSGIEIKLGQPSIINHIRLLLWDRDSRSYSYFIEVSMDELDWIRVIDHSHYLCRSWQKLYFPARVCRLYDLILDFSVTLMQFCQIEFHTFKKAKIRPDVNVNMNVHT
ncbi:BTB/POZ domain-containing protein 9 [Cricetulus griseus]|nr:BTB/POZ domain-containing protein 9 [Cricetulus griseus]